MKTLLCAINAKFIHSNIAVRLISGYAKENYGYDIDIMECTINNYIPQILKEIYTHKPELVGFSCYIWNIEYVKKLCTLLKKVLPDVIIVLGGPEVSYNPQSTLKNTECDYIISGEGEKSFSMLLQYLNGKCDIEKVEGLCFLRNDTFIKNECTRALDLGTLPFAYKDFNELEHRICYYEASRGCPFSCSYCLSSIEKGVRFAPIEKVKRELMVFLQHNVPQVKFVDRTFNADKHFALEIIKFIKENDNGITNFHFEVESRLLDEEMLCGLCSSRKKLFQMEIGVQSTNEQTLDAVNRKNDFEWLTHCAQRLLKNYNIHIHLDLIAGLPFEDIKSFRNSFDMVASLHPHQLQLGFLKVLHGSHIESRCSEFKMTFSPYAPYEVLSTKWLSFDDILYLKDIEELVECFYNSNRFIYSLHFLEKRFNGMFEMFESLNTFRKKKGTDSLTSNKQYAYTFLYNYCVDTMNEKEQQIFRSVIKLDYLLHEKPRSMPCWSDANILDKNEIYAILSDEKLKQKVMPQYADTSARELLKLMHIESFPINPFTLESHKTTVVFDYSQRDMWNNAHTFMIS